MKQVPAKSNGHARILVVEDEKIVARDLADSLAELGYSVVATVGSGEEAIDKVREQQPDLVLMDIRLGGALDGVQAAVSIRQEHDIPVIYLTAHSDDETLRRAKVTGPFGYLVKPFAPTDLRCAIEIALYKHQFDTLARKQLEALALTDALTGLANRRGLTERLVHIMREGRRGRMFVLVLIDLDHFKTVNDSSGHLIGDQVLVAVAAAINRHLRDIDFAARFGGDEFCLVLADTTGEEARLVLDRLRARIDDFPKPARVTASLGGCAYKVEYGIDAEAMLADADKALYRAKRSGRNRVDVDA